MHALAVCGEEDAQRASWHRAAAPGASGVRPCVAALQRLAVELFAGADVAAEEPSSQLVGAVEALLLTDADALRGRALFGFRVLSAAAAAATDGGGGASPTCGDGQETRSETRSAMVKGLRDIAMESWYAQDIDALKKTSKGAGVWSESTPSKKKADASPEARDAAAAAKAAMLSPPAADMAALAAVFDDCFARVGSWNILGNGAFRGSAAAAEAPAPAAPVAGSAGAAAAAAASGLSKAAARAKRDADAIESSRGKAESLTTIIHREGWSACALQELPVGNTLDALMRGGPRAGH
jgi:hypothetical protein